MFQPFIDGESDIDSDTACESLRGIWDALSQVKIGTIKIGEGERVYEQLKPLSNNIKSLLNAAGASLTKKCMIQLGLIG